MTRHTRPDSDDIFTCLGCKAKLRRNQTWTRPLGKDDYRVHDVGTHTCGPVIRDRSNEEDNAE